MAIRVEVFARGHGNITDSELSKMADWHRELFADQQHIIDAFVWENKRDMGFSIQTYKHDELVGFAHVFVRQVRLDDSPLLMGGLGSVVTAKDHQGMGIGRATVEKANVVILENFRADIGVLLCSPALVSFYEQANWRRYKGAVLIEQPTGKTSWPHEAMILEKEPGGPSHGTLDLCGLPF